MAPLSEREQKILEEIERGFYDEDPLFARDVPSDEGRGGRVRAGIGVFLFGLLLLVGFFTTRLLLAGLLAFGAMVAGILLLASPVSALVNDTKNNAKARGRTLKRSLSGWDSRFRHRRSRDR